MNTSDNEQLQLFVTPELPVESSFYDWEIDQEGAEKSINGSGSSLSQDEADKLHLNDNTDTERCQENQGRNATHTTNVKIQSTSTLNQSKQQFIGNSISKDSVQQKLPKPKEFQELQFMGCSNLMDTNSESRSDFPLLFSTETDIPLEILGITPEPMASDRSFIEIPGHITTEKYQETTTFIISTEIGETTESKTSNVFSKPNILDNIKSVEKEELNQVKLRITQEQLEDWTQEKLTHQQDKQLQQSEDAQVLSDKLLKKEQNQQELIGSTFECLKCSKNPITPSQVKPQAESEPDISQDEQLPQPKQRLHSAESSISTQLLGGDEELLLNKRGNVLVITNYYVQKQLAFGNLGLL